jgi:hypothetical protein
MAAFSNFDSFCEKSILCKKAIHKQHVKPYLRNFSFCGVLSMERIREMAADTIQGTLFRLFSLFHIVAEKFEKLLKPKT